MMVSRHHYLNDASNSFNKTFVLLFEINKFLWCIRFKLLIKLVKVLVDLLRILIFINIFYHQRVHSYFWISQCDLIFSLSWYQLISFCSIKIGNKMCWHAINHSNDQDHPHERGIVPLVNTKSQLTESELILWRRCNLVGRYHYKDVKYRHYMTILLEIIPPNKKTQHIFKKYR